MKYLSFFSLLFLGLLLTACGGNTDTAASTPSNEELQSQLNNEVMAIHDEVMPKMSQINQLSRGLRSYLDNHSEMVESEKEKINEVVNALEQAGDSMMDWMAAYGDLKRKFGEMDHAAIMQALEKEKDNISGVQEAMFSSIEAGEKLLAELQ